MTRRYLFTSESVTEGHPDKLADQISDAVLDAIMAGDPMGRVACETLVTTGVVLVAGEISTELYVDIPRVVRDTIRGIGYTDAKFGIDGDTCGVIAAIQEQSADIAIGVDRSWEVRHGDTDPLDEVGAGDQGMMIGYAGRFEIGGPKAEPGLTGRQIMVDSYGSMAPHGGGCFSGKDPTKVDRSAAYMGRYVAKNVVAAGVADRVQLQVAYAIGTARPVSLSMETFGTSQVDPERLERTVA